MMASLGKQEIQDRIDRIKLKIKVQEKGLEQAKKTLGLMQKVLDNIK